jgi:hypothetical protein
MLFAKADESVANHPPWDETSKKSCIRAVAIDEAHHIRGGRPDASATYILARYRNLWTISLTVTANLDLPRYIGVPQLSLEQKRNHSRFVFSFSVWPGDTAIV